MSTMLSIIVPIYNAGKNLESGLESIAKQIQDGVEVILVNDGSTDDSGRMCNGYAEKYDWITVLHQKNQGALMARRNGMSKACGKYIMIPDSDDYLLPFALSKIMSVIRDYLPDMICYDWLRFEIETGKKQVIKQFPDLMEDTEMDTDLIKTLTALSYTTGALSSKVFKKNMVDLDDDYSHWQGKVTICDDLFQVLPIIDNTKSIYYIAEPLYVYCKSNNSLSTSYEIGKITSYAIVLERREAYLKKWGIPVENIMSSRERTFNSILVLIYCASRIGMSQLKNATSAMASNETLMRLYNDSQASFKTKKAKYILPLVMRQKNAVLKAVLSMKGR